MWTFFKHLPIKTEFKENPESTCLFRKLSNEVDMFGLAPNSLVLQDPDKKKKEFLFQTNLEDKVWEVI